MVNITYHTLAIEKFNHICYKNTAIKMINTKLEALWCNDSTQYDIQLYWLNQHYDFPMFVSFHHFPSQFHSAENGNFYKNRSNFVQSFQLILHIIPVRLHFGLV